MTANGPEAYGAIRRRDSPRTAPILVISPVRDEGDFLEATIQAMRDQTVQPAEWILVDDGSTDDTAEIIDRHAAVEPFLRRVTKPDRGFRQVGSGVIEAFRFGLSQAQRDDYRYIVKLDGDITFGPRYIECILAAFENDSKLAAVSGRVFRPEGGRLVEERLAPDMVTGQFKFYRRRAFEAIGGFEQTLQWDGIDIHRCRMNGWRTVNIDEPDAVIHHHRLMGSSEHSIINGRLRWGRGIHYMGYHPIYALASGVFRMREKPYVIGGALIVAGYVGAALQRKPRYPDANFRRTLRRWQLKRLLTKMRGDQR